MDEFRRLLTERLRGRGDLARLAEASGVAPHLISRWRDGVTTPSPANLRKVAPHLGVTYEAAMRMCGYLPEEQPYWGAEEHQLAGILRDPRLMALLERVAQLPADRRETLLRISEAYADAEFRPAGGRELAAV